MYLELPSSWFECYFVRYPNNGNAAKGGLSTVNPKSQQPRGHIQGWCEYNYGFVWFLRIYLVLASAVWFPPNVYEPRSTFRLLFWLAGTWFKGKRLNTKQNDTCPFTVLGCCSFIYIVDFVLDCFGMCVPMEDKKFIQLQGKSSDPRACHVGSSYPSKYCFFFL